MNNSVPEARKLHPRAYHVCPLALYLGGLLVLCLLCEHFPHLHGYSRRLGKVWSVEQPIWHWSCVY